MKGTYGMHSITMKRTMGTFFFIQGRRVPFLQWTVAVDCPDLLYTKQGKKSWLVLKSLLSSNVGVIKSAISLICSNKYKLQEEKNYASGITGSQLYMVK
jgi:hypothetical protein